MKSFKMKALALATLGLGGLVLAGSAFAACPAGPTTAQGGAWSGQSLDSKGSTLTIVGGSPGQGYDGTSCKLQSSLANNGAATAAVRDDSPSAPGEARYRAQFIFDPTNLSGANGTNQAVIFLANAQNSFSGILPMLEVDFAGKGGGSTTSGKRIFIVAACVTGGTCGVPVNLPVQNGPNRIEFDLVTGADGTGSLRYWVNDAATTGLSDGSPTGSITISGGNAGWVGVKTAFLGMSSPSTAYRTVNTNINAWFDEFDSRRQTFIGH